MQLVAGAHPAQVMQLREERRDADAAGDQYVPAGGRVDGEQVVRAGNHQLGAHLHLLVHEGRAALGLLFQAHADLVAGGVGRVAHQRIGVAELAAVGTLHLHDDMAAAGEGRQRLAVGTLQGEALDQGGRLLHRGHAGRHHFIGVGHRSPRLRLRAAPGAALMVRGARRQTARHRYFISR
ncbi:hypothetical protein D3C85_1424730 [compost metagenome]